jgi:hypothetical protein
MQDSRRTSRFVTASSLRRKEAVTAARHSSITVAIGLMRATTLTRPAFTRFSLSFSRRMVLFFRRTFLFRRPALRLCGFSPTRCAFRFIGHGFERESAAISGRALTELRRLLLLGLLGFTQTPIHVVRNEPAPHSARDRQVAKALPRRFPFSASAFFNVGGPLDFCRQPGTG